MKCFLCPDKDIALMVRGRTFSLRTGKAKIIKRHRPYRSKRVIKNIYQPFMIVEYSKYRLNMYELVMLPIQPTDDDLFNLSFHKIYNNGKIIWERD